MGKCSFLESPYSFSHYPVQKDIKQSIGTKGHPSMAARLYFSYAGADSPTCTHTHTHSDREFLYLHAAISTSIMLPSALPSCCHQHFHHAAISTSIMLPHQHFHLIHPSASPFSYSRKVNKGVGVENVHYLCDGLWIMKNYQK